MDRINEIYIEPFQINLEWQQNSVQKNSRINTLIKLFIFLSVQIPLILSSIQRD